jgi:hypothetical protein
MAQRQHHYEQAFEDYLRARRIPYVAVDEAKKALLPDPTVAFRSQDQGAALKSFDFVIYGQGQNLLVEIKGRKIGRKVSATGRGRGGGRLENWVTMDDVASLGRWEQLFGPEFQAAFVFVYWCDDQPPDALFQEMFECRGRWYALRAVKVRDYTGVMKLRSPRWRTVNVPPAVFEKISAPFAPPRPNPLPTDGCLTRTFHDLGESVDLPALERLVR